MGQSDSINNRTLKFVVSYCIIFKQVEISTIIASVESTGSWLHADTYLCPVFERCRDIARYRSNSPILLHCVRCLSVVEILHDIVRTQLFTAHKSTSVLYGKKHGKYLYLENSEQQTLISPRCTLSNTKLPPKTDIEATPT